MNPQPSTLNHFTAAQLARALGVTASAVLQRLRSIPADGTQTVRGQPAKAWSASVLPGKLLADLEALRHSRCCRTLGELLADPREPWTPPVPWHSLPQAFRDAAVKLSTALAPPLGRQHELSGPDLMDRARTGYRQTFGHVITDDKLRYLMDRATKRDNGFQQWERHDLFLDDAAFHQAPAGLPVSGLHSPLDDHVKQVRDKTSPTLEDRAHLFHAAFQHFEQLTAGRKPKGEQRAVKHSLIEYLHRTVPGLYRPHFAPENATAPGPAVRQPLRALRQNFNRSYREWNAGARNVESIADRRAGNSGRKGYRCSECEKRILAAAARFRGPHGETGNVDLAVKNLCERCELCVICLELLSRHPLPASMRRRVTPNKLQVACLKGPEFVRAIGPTHHNAWSDCAPGDRFVIDDMTTNELAWDEVDGQIISGQAQLLYTEDEFSGFPLPFLLYFGAPNSRTIKKALWAVFTCVGLPHVALLTERGVFNNRMLNGERAARAAIAFRELEAGLKNLFQFDHCDDDTLARLRTSELGLRDPALGLKIQHAFSPQAKTVERSFYEIQKRASILPGFGGFNQRAEQSRAQRDFDRRVKDGNEHPGNEYLHLSELRKNYEVICAENMRRPVNGRRHRGRSPLDVWSEALQRRPFRKLPAEIEALFALRQRCLTVQTQGIRIERDKFQDDFYFNGHTGPLVGRKVVIRDSSDLPEFIFVEHPDTRKLLKVERVQTLRRNATPEELAKSNAARRAHINGALGEIGNLASPVTSWIERSNDFTPEDKERGRVIAEATAQHQAEQAAAKRQAVHLQRKAGALGHAVPERPRNPKRLRQGLDLESEALAEIADFESQKPEGQP